MCTSIVLRGRTAASFIGEGAALGGLVGHLQARRLGSVVPTSRLGILTHHLVQDEATETRFFGGCSRSPARMLAARWLAAAEVLLRRATSLEPA